MKIGKMSIQDISKATELPISKIEELQKIFKTFHINVFSMSIEELPDIVDDLSIEHSEDGIRIRFGDSATNWIACDDEFIES